MSPGDKKGFGVEGFGAELGSVLCLGVEVGERCAMQRENEVSSS